METVRTGTAEHARARSLVIAGVAVMAIGAAMTVWETHAEHALVLQAAQGTPPGERTTTGRTPFTRNPE